MNRKDIANEELFNNFDSSLSQYAKLARESNASSPLIFDEIAIIEERYNHGNIVNQGGMKKIYKTRDSLTNRSVAKAVLIDSDDERKAESFLREARLTAALEHPNIIPIYDIGIDEEEGPYFIMKLLGGRNLSEIIRAQVQSSEYTQHDFMGIFTKICDAISYAHSKGIIHLDLKPENIQIGEYGEVTVCDWGLAKVIDSPEDISDFESDLDPMLYNDMTMDGVIKGTPGYMAPEQIDSSLGPKDQRSDIYALGGILYSLLTLKNPHKTDTVENVLKNTLEGRINRPSTRTDVPISTSLEAVAMKALDANPDNRYQTVTELRKEINNWLGGFATDAENANFLKSSWLLFKRHKTVSLLFFLIFFGTVMSFYFVKQNERKAVEALNKYEKEKKFSDLVSKNSVNQLKEINENYFKKFEFNKALTFINDAVKLYPDNAQIHALNGEALFYVQEFSRAVEAFKKSGSFKYQEPYKEFLKIAFEFSDRIKVKGSLSASDLADLVYSCDGDLRERVLTFIIDELSSQEKYKSLYIDVNKKKLIDRHLEFCRLMTAAHLSLKSPLKLSKEHFEEKLKFTYRLDIEGIHLDLNGTEQIEKLIYYRHLPLVSLDLSNTSFWLKWIFNHYSLKSVDIRNTNIMKMNSNDHAWNKLTEVIMTKEQFENSHKGLNATKDRLKLIVK